MLYTASFYAPQHWVADLTAFHGSTPEDAQPSGRCCRFYIRPSIYYGPTGVKR